MFKINVVNMNELMDLWYVRVLWRDVGNTDKGRFQLHLKIKYWTDKTTINFIQQMLILKPITKFRPIPMGRFRNETRYQTGRK